MFEWQKCFFTRVGYLDRATFITTYREESSARSRSRMNRNSSFVILKMKKRKNQNSKANRRKYIFFLLLRSSDEEEWVEGGGIFYTIAHHRVGSIRVYVHERCRIGLCMTHCLRGCGCGRLALSYEWLFRRSQWIHVRRNLAVPGGSLDEHPMREI